MLTGVNGKPCFGRGYPWRLLLLAASLRCFLSILVEFATNFGRFQAVENRTHWWR